MPRKGMRSLWFSTKPPSSFSVSHSPSPSPSRRLSEAAMERSIAAAETMIMKWNPEASSFAKVTSLFYENRGEARDFIKSVAELQKAMHFLDKEDPRSEKLVRSQKLMEIAMKRLQKEFYQILSMNRAYLDPESVSARSSLTSTRSSMSDYDDDDGSEEEIRIAGESVTEVEQVSAAVMADLRLIAESMISTGYGKECVKIYKTIRKSIVDEGIYRLGVERVSNSKIHKMDWELIELKTKNWLSAVKIAVKTLFNGERILCDHVFAASDTIRESCFAEITKEGAQILFGFPELAVKNKKNSPEKVFRMLDMYTAISENWPEIESIFSFESTSAVLSQAITALVKLGESVRTMVADYESAIQKDKSKSPVPGGGVHHLTVAVMNYLSLLGDYSNILPDILTYSPLPEKSSLPESYFDSSDSDGSPKQAISLRFAWLILVLLCKLDSKASHYKDVSLAYLFLSNNLQHVVDKIRKSNIKYLLGDDWISKQEAKVKQFASSYERLAWGSVVESLTQDPTAGMSAEEVRECLRRFNRALEQAYLKQSGCVVDDSNLRQQIKLSITRKVVEAYTEFYHTQRVEAWRGDRHLVRFAPQDVRNYLSDLFFGTVEAGSSSLPSRLRSP
ncbi:exocyst complex component EXO70H1-like [Diospyros lotus]|uniref:exocyst complex component EXO70H1-like n=1 Tax=Diospyros lotus TaxID=55363 RepID=UPI002257532C|nr:exocyst complex component EXO70H1-like [Diospyros lotus]